MDVSRIEAISPKQIDWRKLTSQEIIDYDAQGVEVPAEYLQWAKEFRNDINAHDKDETTYETANSTATTVQKSSSSVSVTADTDDTTDDTTSAADDTSSAGQEQDENKTEAQAQRQALEEAGVSLRKQARIFTGESKASSKALIRSIMTIVAVENASKSEIAALESYMEKILSDAEKAQNELKAEVGKINDNKSDKGTFDKINRLEKQLEKYGTAAQAKNAASETDFNNYDTKINDQTDAILHAQDYGTETVGVGEDLLSSLHGRRFYILDYLIGKKAVKSGNKAVDRAETTSEVQAQALETNTANSGKVSEYKSQIQDKTGVAAVKTQNNTDNQTTQETKDEGGSTDANKNSQTETDKAASGNLDQILQAKIKKGENVNA